MLKYKQAKKDSIVKEFKKVLLGTVLVTLMVILILFVMNNYMLSKMEHNFDILQEFNELSADVEDVSFSLKIMQQTGSETDIGICQEKIEDLLNSAQLLETKIPIRKVVDLAYLMETYSQESLEAIESRKKDASISASEQYRKAVYIYSLIKDRQMEAYKSVAQYAKEQIIYLKIVKTRYYFITIIGICGVLLGVAFYIFRFARKLTEPIVKLAKASTEINLGNLDIPPIEKERNDEVGILVDTFNLMVVRINTQIIQLTDKYEIERILKEREVQNFKMKAQLHKSEFKLLRSQINPHFLFNALNSVTSMAYMENAEKTAKTSTIIAEFLRYILKDVNSTKTIAQEIKNIQDYLFIQQVRYGEGITIDISLESGCQHLVVPSLTLQPLVENAFVHGFQEITEDKYLGINVSTKNDRMKICVCDNGRGIAPEKLNRLNQITQSDIVNEEMDSIGIYNVAARLKIFFNGDVKIEFSSYPNEYTQVLIDVPYVVKE